MTDELKPKRTRRSKAQIAADNLAIETAKAATTASELTKEAHDGQTAKGRTVAAILATINKTWDDLPRDFGILVNRTDTTVKAAVSFQRTVEVETELGLETTPSLL